LFEEKAIRSIVKKHGVTFQHFSVGRYISYQLGQQAYHKNMCKMGWKVEDEIKVEDEG
jgi:hypothetical protein